MSDLARKLRTRLFVAAASVLLSIFVWAAPAQAEDFPLREGLMFGLDPGFAIIHTHERDTLPKLIGVNLRAGWMIENWVGVGGDFTMMFVVSDDNYTSDDFESDKLFGPKFLQPMVTFVPVADLMLRVGGGFNPYDLNQFPISAILGWEFPIGMYSGFGLAVGANYVFNIDHRPDWQIYTFSLIFSGYRVDRGWFDTIGKDPEEF